MGVVAQSPTPGPCQTRDGCNRQAEVRAASWRVTRAVVGSDHVDVTLLADAPPTSSRRIGNP